MVEPTAAIRPALARLDHDRPEANRTALRRRASPIAALGATIGRAALTGVNLRIATRQRRVTGRHTTVRPTIVREDSDLLGMRRARRVMVPARPEIARPATGLVAARRDRGHLNRASIGHRDRDRLNRASTGGHRRMARGHRRMARDHRRMARGHRRMARGHRRTGLGLRNDSGRLAVPRAQLMHRDRNAN